jgi:hypothetical protein
MNESPGVHFFVTGKTTGNLLESLPERPLPEANYVEESAIYGQFPGQTEQVNFKAIVDQRSRRRRRSLRPGEVAKKQMANSGNANPAFSQWSMDL